MQPLEDGRYDALIVHAEHGSDGVVHVELTLTSGPHKGEVVSLRATSITRDPIDLLALPATLTVVDGVPDVSIDD